MATGKVYFDVENEKDQRIKFNEMLKEVVQNGRIVFPADAQVPHYCKDLIEKLVVYEPKRRITVEDLKQHPFMLVDDFRSTSAPIMQDN